MTGSVPSVPILKQQARRLRAALADDGDFVSHGEALELVARQYGARNWNTLRAVAAGTAPRPITIGDTVRGRYLGQGFTASVRGVQALGGGRRRVTLHLDEPVDVVKFDSFSALRRRVTGVIGPGGATAEKTSDGQPHLWLDLAA